MQSRKASQVSNNYSNQFKMISSQDAFVESLKFDCISVNNILDTIHKTPACCIYRQMWETHGLNFNTREKFVCSAPKWLIPVALVYFIDFQFLYTPLKSKTLIIVSNLFILNIFQVSLVSISISTLNWLEEHILKELRKMLGMLANRNIISSRKKTGNWKRKCVRSVSEPCSSSKCLRLFPRGDNVQSFDKTVFNYQAEIRSTVRYHSTVLSKRFSTSSGEFSCEEMLAQHRRILFWRSSDSSQQIIKSSFFMIWSPQKLPPEIVSGNSLNILE